jgi:deferrochelatase/peroxidase EfeB
MHSFVTVAIPFDADAARSAAVEEKLNLIGNPAGPRLRDPLDAAAFVHFLSITLLHGEGGAPAYLIIEVNADGTTMRVLDELHNAIGEPLRELIESAGLSLGDTPLRKFLERYRQDVGQGWFATPGVNFDGTPGLTVSRIKREHALATTISGILDEAPRSDSALATLQYVKGQLWADEAQKWAFVAEPASFLDPMPSLWTAVLPVLGSAIFTLLWPFLLVAIIAFALAWWVGGVVAGAVLAVLFVIAAAMPAARWLSLAAAAVSLAIGWLAGPFLVALWAGSAVLTAEYAAIYFLLRRKEASDVAEDIPPSAAKVAEIMKRENFAAQNHMAASSTMKPGRLRRLTLRIGLWAAGQLALHFSIPGFLATTSVIHFARWILLPGTNQLLFRSNFDGTWESYLEDFIELAHQGVTGIWSNTVGFPKTSNLFNDGASDGDRLRRWTRRQQRPSLVWYSAYPQLTLLRVRTNAAIRQGIACAATEAEAEDWLACFGSTPRPADLLEAPQIPTLVFGGLRRLTYGASLVLRLSPDRDKNKEWLASLEPEISYGDQLAASEALLIGLSRSGLEKLGLEPRHIETFPVAFQHGSAEPWRARAVGDIGNNSPEKWWWGGKETAVDAVMLIYGREQAHFDDLVLARIAAAKSAGHTVAYQVRFAPNPPRDQPVVEPFGFVDGVSDPVIRGVGQWTLERNRNHLIAPGEVVIGYPDNLGYFPPSPSVAASDDPQNILPAATSDLSRSRPDFSNPQPTGQKDLGINGTFLVVRHLEQDVKGFKEFVAKAAKVPAVRASAPSDVPPEQWLEAKMVGRWQDGTSLVRHPQRPGSHRAASGGPSPPDNDFLFGVEDPNGLRCPFGAHIRRANPRESFTPVSPDPALEFLAKQSGANPYSSLSPTAQLELSITNRHRIVRVGRHYDPQDALTKPGLMFMCLNVDIERQFEFVQKTWLLGSSFEGLDAEVDPVLGQRTESDVLTIPTPCGPLRVKGLKDFVTVKGSGYFFLPGKKAIRFLSY